MPEKNILEQFGITSPHPGTAIGKDWLAGQARLASYNPNDESLLGEVQTTQADDLDKILTTAHQTFLTWRAVPAPKRGELIRLIGDRLRQHKEALGTLVSLEMGKSKQEGDGEVQEMIDMADFAVGQSRMLYGSTMHSERPLHRMYEQWHPLGVVGVFTAFNFPVAVWAWNAFLAVICGNAVVWKPSPKTPLCAIAVHKLCAAVLSEYQYPPVFNLVNSANIDLARQLIDDPRLSLVSFTGSTKVGREVNERVANRFGRVLLELSGNNAVIVDQSADLKRAILPLVFAAVGTAGQRCTTLRRLIVHEAIYTEVVNALLSAYQQLRIGEATDPDNHIGPLIDQAAVEHYLQAIETIKAAGGKIFCGGKRLPRKGYFVEPTIVEARPDWPIVNEETFAPILYVMPYQTLEQAIAINNQVRHGLSSAIFTRDIESAEHFLSAQGSDCGIANVNIGTSGAEIGGAFGGEKETGGGREAGSDAWKAYMRRQTTTINYSSQLTLAQGIKFDIEE